MPIYTYYRRCDRARSISTGRMKRTASGGAEGVFVPSNDPIYNDAMR